MYHLAQEHTSCNTKECRASLPRVLIVTPFLPPAPGGSGIYTELLAAGLVDGRWASKVIVLTERFPFLPQRSFRKGGAIEVRRQFPYRAGASRRHVGSYAKYAVQNLQLLALPMLVNREKIDIVLFHASLLYHPGVSRILVKHHVSRSRACWIADVRDPLLPHARFNVLYPFHAIIACSENVMRNLRSDSVLASQVHLVPIPVQVSTPDSQVRAEVMARFGLKSRSYVFSSSGIVGKKGVNDAIEAVRIARAVDPSLVLVVVGKARDRDRRHEAAEQEGVLRYLGIVDHETSLALAADAAVDLNLSKVDSMPRGSLESLLMATPVLVPAGIPEFERCCGGNVVDASDHVEVAKRILSFRQERCLPAYDASRHSVGYVAKETAEVFSKASARLRTSARAD